MFARRFASMLAIGIVVAGGLAGCEKIKNMAGMVGLGGATTDFRNAQIDVSDTPCSDNAKFSTLVLQDGKYELGQYQFELFGDTKHGDVTGHTQSGNPDSSVFVGNCAIDGQTSQVLFVYGTDESGKFKRLGAANLTDNGNGLVQSYDVKDSTILVEQNQGNPPKLTKNSYALLNGKLTNLSPNASTPESGADVDTVSFQVFHDKLSPYGKWIDHPRWGEVWHPTEAGFKPYENGHWEDNDEYGTVWVSNEAWGDAPTHYGRWGYDPNYGGWLWVPGYVWAPSWVVWRAGEDNVGWFPMPPGAYDGEGDYPDDWAGWYGYRDLYGAAFDEAAFFALWSFVPAADIYAVDIRSRIIDRRGYGRFIGRTRNWTHYGIAHGHVFSRALEGRRFREAFHRDMPGSRHEFAGRHVTSLAAGHRIAGHEHLLGRGNEGGRGLRAAGFSHGGGMSGHGAMGGIGRTGGMGTAHTGGFGHHEGGFTRSGNGFSHGGNGFARSGGGGGNGFGGVQHSSGGNGMGGFGHPGGGGGNGMGGFNRGNGFGNGGGMGGMQQHQGFSAGHTAPQPQHNSGGNHHH